jgi:predicted transposase/invertase (TIGR01784 family)
MESTVDFVSGYNPAEVLPAVLEEPKIAYLSKRTIGRYVDILYDEWFKRILGADGNEDVILDILRELIPERDIVGVSYAKKKRRKVSPFIDGHDAYFDIECIEKDGTRFVVEMQKSKQVNFPERALFYSTFPIQEQVEAERKEQEKRRSHNAQFRYAPVYIISFLNFSIHADTDRILFRYDLRERTTGERMTDRINFIFLEMTNFKREEIRPDDSFVEKISYAFTHMGSLKERPAALMGQVFERLFDACELKSLPEEEQNEYKTMTTKMDWENILYTAELEGEERGKAQGRAEGWAEGRAEGEEIGTRQALVETARRMVEQLGYSPQQASEVTGLAQEQFMHN